MPDLAEYAEWLRRRGRSDSTVDRYCSTLARYLEDPAPIKRAIEGKKRSPNYRRFLIACLRSWGAFRKDHDLRDWLDEIKRPPATPASPREPFDVDTWRQILRAIEGADWPPSWLFAGFVAAT